jgi:hypothetical protein
MIGFERHEMFKRGGGARAGERRTISLPVIPRTADHQGVHIHEASFQVIGVSLGNRSRCLNIFLIANSPIRIFG